MTVKTVMLVGIGFGLAIIGTPGTVTLGAAYSFTFKAFGGTGPYKFTQTGLLPSGLSFTDNGNGTATISGTTSSPGNFTISVSLQDGLRKTVTASYTLVVQPLPLMISGHIAGGIAGAAASGNYSASGGLGPYTFAVISPTFPTTTGMSSAGAATGNWSSVGSYAWVVQVTDSLGAHATLSDSCSNTYAALAVSGSFAYSMATATVNQVVGPQTLSGGQSPYSVSVLSGTAPPGITFGISGSNCTASGTCTTVGSYTFTLRYTSNDGQHVDSAQTIRVPYFAPLYAAGEAGVILDFQDLATMFQNSGGTTPVTATGQSIVSIKDKINGNLCVFTGTAPTLQFDATNNVYYAQFPSGGGAAGTVSVPVALNGNANKSLVFVGTFNSALNETPLLYGANATAGCFAIGNGAGFGGISGFEQGSGHGVTMSPSASGSEVAAFTKNNTSLVIYRKDSSGTNNQAGTTIGAANITVNTLNVGYYPSLAGYDFQSRMYSGLLISRVITGTEITTINGAPYA